MNPAEQYIFKQPEPFASILMFVRQLLKDTIPDIQEKKAYGLPFYYHNKKPYCYFNVAKKNSVVERKGRFADICFMKGHLVEHPLLIAGNDRKLVKSYPIFDLEEINAEALINIFNLTKKLY